MAAELSAVSNGSASSVIVGIVRCPCGFGFRAQIDDRSLSPDLLPRILEGSEESACTFHLTEIDVHVRTQRRNQDLARQNARDDLAECCGLYPSAAFQGGHTMAIPGLNEIIEESLAKPVP